MSDRYSRIVVIEDGIKNGGISSALSDAFRELGIAIPIHSIGIPVDFFEHAKRNQILEDLGITVQSVARQLVSWFSSGAKQEGTQLHVDESASRKPTH
jgi:1-deoxy-D-xylulose-5-phosphate synthase